MKRPDRDPGQVSRARYQGPDPPPHLVGSLVGECHGRDLLWRHPAVQYQMRDATREHSGLASPWPSDHDDRAVLRLHGLPLSPVQPICCAVRDTQPELRHVR